MLMSESERLGIREEDSGHETSHDCARNDPGGLVPATGRAQTPDDRIEAAFNRAKEAGLPLSLLEDKVEEEQAKDVAMERIAAAVELRLESLKQAQQVMGGVVHDLNADQISAGADALGSGVSAEALEAICHNTPPNQLAHSRNGERSWRRRGSVEICGLWV